MQAGIHHQPRGAEQFGIQPHEIGGDIGEDLHLRTQRLGIEAPALAKRHIAGDGPELRPAFLAHLDVALHVVAGHRLVTHQRVERRRVLLLAHQVHIGARRALAVGAGRAGMGGAARHLAERRLAHHLDAIGRQRAKPGAELAADMADEAVGLLEIGGARRLVEGQRREGLRAHRIIGVAVLHAGLPRQRILRRLDAGHFGPPDAVDVLCGQLGGGVEPQLVGIIGRAAGQRAGADPAFGRGRQAGGRPVDHPVIGGLEVENGGARLRQQRISLGALQRAGRHQPFGLGLHVCPQRGILAITKRRAAGQLRCPDDDILDLELRRANAGLLTGAGALQPQIKHGRHGAQAGDVVFQIGAVRHRVGVDQEIRQLAVQRIEPRIEGRAIQAIGIAQRRPLGLQRPDVIIHLALGRQLRAVEGGLHARRAGLPPGHFGIGGGIADVVPPVAAGLDPKPRCQLRLRLQPFGKFAVEKGGQPRILGRCGNGSGGRLRECWCQRQGEAGKQHGNAGGQHGHGETPLLNRPRL